jgi:outer membrane protein OmpA-like peptidoglycan-associated protein
VAHVVPPSFEVAVLRPAAPAPLPPTLAPVLNTDPVQNAVLREPPPPSSASRNLPDSRSRAVPLVNERLAFVSEEPPPPAALGPTPRSPGPRGTTPAAPATKVPPKPNESEGTAPPAHAATPADPNPVTPQAVPAPVIASPKGGAQSSASAAEPEKGERGALRLQFAPDTTALPADVERALSPVMAALQRAPKSRIVLRGYAAGSGDAASRGKRVALGRVLELRNYFIAHGIDSTRIDVRALGAPEDKGIADRVDIGLLD